MPEAVCCCLLSFNRLRTAAAYMRHITTERRQQQEWTLLKNQLQIMRYMPIRIRLLCQKFETESETYKSQMYWHNAG